MSFVVELSTLTWKVDNVMPSPLTVGAQADLSFVLALERFCVGVFILLPFFGFISKLLLTGKMSIISSGKS